jgi:ferric-chelate reductase
MDMPMGMDGGGTSIVPLNASGVDFSNETQAMDFLGDMLDDTVFQVIGNQYARYFWYGVVVVIGIAAIFNVTQKVELRQRLRASAANNPRPAKPSSAAAKAIATFTAIYREASYPHFSPSKTAFWLKVPPLGTIILVLTYLSFILALEFINNDIPGAQHYTAIGIRAAWLAIAQVPLLILLAGKNNLIGLFTGVSYERLNVLHRWVARGLLLMATIHFGAQSYGWNEYGLMQLEWSTDTCPPTGIAAYGVLLWLNLSTLAPIRHFSYEFFVVLHIISFFGFIIAVMYHLPSTAFYSRVYIWIPIGLYLFDRIVRTAYYMYHNIRPGQATLEAMEGGVTKIRIRNKTIKKWAPGSHVLLSLPRFGFAQSHPATIASIPSSHDGELVFILKSQRGFTHRMLKSATTSSIALLPDQEMQAGAPKSYTALIDGPYGGCHADFAAFDRVMLIAGSTGVTFTLSTLLDIAHRASSQKLPLRRLDFVWVIKNTNWTSWIIEELKSAHDQLEAAGIDIAIKIYVTCDEKFTNGTEEIKECGCECDKSNGPCCCTVIDDAEEDDINQLRNRGKNTTDEKHDTPDVSSSSSSFSLPTRLDGRTKTSARGIYSYATFQSGRPSLYDLISDSANQAEGEMGVAVCGPMGLSTTARMSVARISDERAVHKGTGAQGICLHVESFCW